MGLAKQITGNALFRGLFLVFQLLNTILISRLTGPEGFGIYSLLIVNASFLLMLTSLGIPSGILYHASVKDMPIGKLMRIAWLSTSIQLLFILPGEFLYRNWRGEFFTWKTEHFILGISGIAYVFTIVLTEKYYALYNGSGRLVSYNRGTAFFNGMLFLSLCSLWVLPFERSAVVVISIFIVIQFLQLVFLALNFKVAKSEVPEADSSSQKVITYALMAYVANLFFFLLMRVDYWILEYYHGATELGIYALPVRIVQLMLILPTLLSSVILPSVASKTLHSASVEMILRLLNTLNVVVVLILLATSGWIIPLVFGDAFAHSISPLLILLPGILFLSAQTFLASYFAGKGRARVNIYSALVALIVAIVLDLLLVPRLGAIGAAVASSVSYLTCFTYSYVCYMKDERYPWYSLLARNSDMVWLRAFLSRSVTGTL